MLYRRITTASAMIYDVQLAYVSEPVAIPAASYMENAYIQERKYGSVQVEVMM